MKIPGNRHKEAIKRNGTPVDEFPASGKSKGNPKVISNGAFKGMKIVPPTTKGVDSILHVSISFMKNIFGLEPNEYMISDESRLSDFTDFGLGGVAPIIKKIIKVYGIDVSDANRGNLLEIFQIIDLQQRSCGGQSVQNEGTSKPIDRKEFEDVLGELRRNARRAGLKRSDIATAVRDVRSKR